MKLSHNELSLNMNSSDKMSESDEVNCSQILYKNFAIKPTQSFLGISIQRQKMYVIQKKSISVFQYFPSSQSKLLQIKQSYFQTCQKVPSLVKQIFLPFEISKYIITEKYICVKSKDKTQIRDIEFQTVYYAQNQGILTTRNKTENDNFMNNTNFVFDTVQELELECEIIDDVMILWKVVMKRMTNSQDAKYLREYWSQKIDIFTKSRAIIKCRSEIIDPANKNRKLDLCKPPLFVNQLGYIQNFYIWPFSSNDVQIGIYFNHKQHENLYENALYEICSFQLKQSNIKNIFYYDFKGNSTEEKNKDGPHLFFAICQNPTKQKSKIKIMIFQVLPQQKFNSHESPNQVLNNYMDQLRQLRKQKKSQQSISNNFLLNELLSENQEKNATSPSNPTSIIQSFTLKDSSSFRKAFYNPTSKVLWIDDTGQVAYRLKFLESGNMKILKEQDMSFVQKIEEYRNGNTAPQLQGIMYDNYPIYKHKAISLQIGLRGPSIRQQEQLFLQANQRSLLEIQKRGVQQKQVIQFDDKQLQKIEQQKLSKDKQLNSQKQFIFVNTQSPSKSSKNLQNHAKTMDISIHHDSSKFETKSKSQQTQTQIDGQDSMIVSPQIIDQEQNAQTIIVQVKNLPQMLKQLNFDRVQQILIRFSSLFTASVTKNINKLKQANYKAKQEIKTKINADIFDLIKEVFQTLMGDTLSDKIEKQVSKSRDFVQKLFSKQIQHFNLLLLEEKTKQENIKKSILQQQLRSIEVIKQASFKFLDVTKIREMQKIAYNQVVIESIKQVGDKIADLNAKIQQMLKQSDQVEKKVFQEVKEIKETFKMLIQLESDEDDQVKNRKESKNQEESQCSDQDEELGFDSDDDEDQQQLYDENGHHNMRRDMFIGEERRINSAVQMSHNNLNYGQQLMKQPMQPPLQTLIQAAQHQYPVRTSEWNSFYLPPSNYAYTHLPPPPPPIYPQSFYQPYAQIPHQAQTHFAPYQNMTPSYQQSFYQPSSVQNRVHPQSFGQIQRVGPQKVDNLAPLKREKKTRKHSTNGKGSSFGKND